MKKTLALLIVAALAGSCKKEVKVNHVKTAEWLIGNWANEMPEGMLLETWTKVNDTTLSGAGFFIKDRDTLHNEKIMLIQKLGQLYYIPTVTGQNNNEPVVFKCTRADAKQMIFENAQHDFPQKISYRQITPDSLVATVSGVENGKAAAETYAMKRQ